MALNVVFLLVYEIAVSLRLSEQMKKILLCLLKTERNPESAGMGEFSKEIRGGKHGITWLK
ncbi:MAG: hypothetical protein ACUVQY_10715 [Thermoproteota archaeon]